MRIAVRILLLISLSLQMAYSQTFSSVTSSQTIGYGGAYAYFNNGIAVTGLGSLDGINLGVTNLEITITGTSGNSSVTPELYMFLVAPNGNVAAMIMFNNIPPSASQIYYFNQNPGTSTIAYVKPAPPGTYSPAGDFNSLNLGQSANGTWRLYAWQRKFSAAAAIVSWKITFGNTNLSPGAPNQSFATSIPLINTTATGNFVTGNNRLSGIVVGDSKGSEVGSSAPTTETTIWYSFVPKCANDKIEISGPNGFTDGWINSSILTSSRSIVRTAPEFFNSTYTYNITNYIPGNTYYLIMDGSETDLISYQVKWYEGGCTVPTITTVNQPVTDYCPNSLIDVNFTVAGTFNTGNRFTAQLSDTLGSFTNPQVLGFKDATTPSAINGTLPAGLKPGKSYKIRVVASIPSTTGSANTGINIIGPPIAPSDITGKPTVCAGEKNVTYSAGTVLNAIKYRWKLTGGAQIVAATADSSSIRVNFGSTNSDISASAVNACGSGHAFQKTITITQPLTPTISIDPVSTTICQGDSVKLQSSFTNQGTVPVFNWKVNNQNYGTSTASVTIKNLKSKDSVSVTLTSNQTCISTPSALSGKLIFTVRDTVKPSVNIIGNTFLCSGSFTSLTANTQNRGNSPVFNWYVNNTLQTNVSDSIFKRNQFQNNDSVWVKLTSNAACVRPASSASAKLKITTTNIITPVVNITGNTPVCKGSSLLLNAQGQNEGNNPVYNWYVNNALQNTSGSSFASSKLQDKDSVYVTLTSDNACAQPAKVNSVKIKISVTDTIKPSVVITGNTPVCQGTAILLIAKTTNKGPGPVFNWYVNNILQSATDSIFKSSSLKNKDSVWVALTSNAACVKPVKVTSLKSIITLTDTIKPSVILTGNTSSCQGSLVTLYAKTTSKGPKPVFDWYLNNILQTTNPDSVFKSSSLKNNDSIWVVMESDAACAKPSKITSTKLILSISETVKPSVTISVPEFSCMGQNVLLKANNENGGTFTWFVNGNQQNINSNNFSGNNFKNGDSVVVRLQSNMGCAVPSIVYSEPIKIIMYDTLKPLITLTADSVFCKGQPVVISSQTENGGSTPSYSWFEGNSNLSNPNKDFSSVMSIGRHSITAVLTSNEKCTNPATVNKTISILVKDSLIIKPVITGDTVLCEGTGTIFSLKDQADSPYLTYNWLLNGLATGKTGNLFTYVASINGETIEVKLTSNEACVSVTNSNTLSLEVSTAITPEVSITPSQEKACTGESIVYKAQIMNPGADGTYSWTQNDQSVGSNADSLVVSFIPQSIVKLNYNAKLACGPFNKTFPALSVQLKEPAPLLLYLSGLDTYCADDETLTFSTNKIENAVYEWKYPTYIRASEKENLIILSMEGNAKVDTLKVKARNGCGEGNELSLVLNPKNCTTLFIPSAILTSDGTGNNLWKIKGIEEYPDALVMVFNRWGMKVYSSLGYAEPWDGTLRGKELPTGTYYYVIEGIENKPITGALTIVH